MSLVNGTSGRHFAISFVGEGKPAAKFKGTSLVKETEGVYRAGIDYANLREVKEGVESGERGAVQSLPKNMEWVTFPYHIRHTISGENYLRLYYPTGGAIQTPSVTYKVNGTPVTKEEYLTYLTPSDAAPKEKSATRDCFIVKMKNILAIKGEEAA